MRRFRLMLVIAACVLITLPAEAAWRRAESTNFIVYSELSDSDLREYVLELEHFDQLLRHLNGVPNISPDIKLRVFVVRDIERVAQHRDDQQDSAGFYAQNERGPYVIVPRRGGRIGRIRLTGHDIVFHEYVHHFMLQYFPTNYPVWYREGFAEFYSTTRFRGGDRIEIGFPSRYRMLWLRYMPWVRHDDMLSNEFPNTGMTYAQGWLLVHYAAFNPQLRTALNTYLQSVAAGGSAREAYNENFGDLEPSLDEQMGMYGARRTLPILRFEQHLAVPETMDIRRLSDEEATVALLYPYQDDALHDRAVEAVAEYPDNPQVHAEMARYYISRSEVDAAVEAADRALALNPNHVEANVFRGLATIMSIVDGRADIVATEEDASREMTVREVLQFIGNAISGYSETIKRDARWAEARNNFLRANRADPLHAPALLYYFLSFPDRQSRPDDAMAALDQAFNLVPQSANIRLRV